jgi:hypothetical protein
MEIALVYDKSGQIDDNGAKSIEMALNLLRQPHYIPNHRLLEKRIRILEQSFSAIPTRTSPQLPPKLDTRNLFVRSLSPATPTSVSSAWTPMPTSVTSNPSFDFNFMHSGRLSNSSVTESVASFDPSSAWTPTNFTDRFSTSPEVESSKNDILEAFLSTISDDPYPQSLENSVFNLQDSPSQPSVMVPTIFDWSNPSFSDEDTEKVFTASPRDVSPGFTPLFLGSFCTEERSPETKSLSFRKPEMYPFKSGFSDEETSHIPTAPNLFSEESGWAV